MLRGARESCHEYILEYPAEETERNEKRCVLVGLDGGVPVIVQGYGSILLSPDRCESPGKKGGNTKRFRPFVNESHLQRDFFMRENGVIIFQNKIRLTTRFRSPDHVVEHKAAKYAA